MQPLSRLFWFTAIAGTLASALLSYALVAHLTTQLQEMVAVCTPRRDSCGWQAIDGAFQAFCLTAVAGNALVFWLAYKIGSGLIEPTVTDALQ